MKTYPICKKKFKRLKSHTTKAHGSPIPSSQDIHICLDVIADCIVTEQEKIAKIEDRIAKLRAACEKLEKRLPH